MSQAMKGKGFRESCDIEADHLSKIPVEIFSDVGSHLPMEDQLNLRLVSRKVQRLTTQGFGDKFFRKLVISTDQDAKDLEMILHFLKDDEIATSVRVLRFKHAESIASDTRSHHDFFAKLCSRLPNSLQELDIARSFDLDPRQRIVSAAPNDLIRALAQSGKKIGGLTISGVCIEYSVLNDFFAVQKNSSADRCSLQRLHLHKCTLHGGTWGLLRVFAEGPSRLRHLYLSSLNTSEKPNEYVCFTVKDVVKGIRNRNSGKIESYKLNRNTAWLLGAEAIRVGLKIAFG